MLVVSVMLNGRENQIIQRHQAVVDRFVADLYHELAWAPAPDAETLAALGDRLLASSGLIESIVVEAGGQAIRKGESAPGMVSYTRPVWLVSDDGPRLQIPAKVTLSLASIEEQVVEERKQLLLGMGGLFFLFGLVLQRVLDRFLTRPFGRNRVHLYKPTDQEIAERHGEMDWVSEIRDAFKHQRFYLLCQPIVSLAEADRGVPSHYELLLRMCDSMGREILPMAFLPAAECYDLMAEIDNWVVRNAMRYIARSDTLPGNCLFLINVSGKSLAAPEFIDFLEAQVRDNALSDQRVCFEVSEASAISNLRTLGDSIKRLRGLGCRIALDDFGSSLSSFGYLKNMQIDYIKIDGGLVRDMQTDRIDAALVQAINEIAHVVGVQTIAEFVETEETLHMLCRLGVDFAQGHCIALPRPVEELFQANHPRPLLKLVSS